MGGMNKGIPLIGYWKRDTNPSDEIPYNITFDRIGLFYYSKGTFYFEGEYPWDLKTIREKINYVRPIGRRGTLISLEDFLKRASLWYQ